MKLSVVLPIYTLSKKLEEMTLMAAVIGKMPEVDELIICEDGGMFSPRLFQAADVYLFSKQNEGFTKNVNKGLKLARGDYIAVINSDVQLSLSYTNLQNHATLANLCIPGKVTSPKTLNQDVPGLAGHFFVLSRTVLNERGYLDERLKMFCSDADYERRVKDIFQQVPEVGIYHEINATLKEAGLMDGKQLADDRETYAKIVNEALQDTQIDHPKYLY